MNVLYDAAAEVQAVCVELGFHYCFIGGLAVIRWGEPRLTRDVDMTILTELGTEEAILDPLLDRMQVRVHDAREFALRSRVVLLRASNGIGVDVALGALDFERRAVARGSWWDVGPASLYTCSADDLVIYKGFAGRDGDWQDIRGIVARQRDRLDAELILTELEPLLRLKESVEDLERVRRLLAG